MPKVLTPRAFGRLVVLPYDTVNDGTYPDGLAYHIQLAHAKVDVVPITLYLGHWYAPQSSQLDDVRGRCEFERGPVYCDVDAGHDVDPFKNLRC